MQNNKKPYANKKMKRKKKTKGDAHINEKV
jgi:hypothetical protein